MWILGLFLDVEVDVVLLHVEVDGRGRVAVDHRLEAADGCPLAGAGRVWKKRERSTDGRVGFKIHRNQNLQADLVDKRRSKQTLATFPLTYFYL